MQIVAEGRNRVVEVLGRLIRKHLKAGGLPLVEADLKAGRMPSLRSVALRLREEVLAEMNKGVQGGGP
jgi:hypothetical protein